ncbi:MAG: hypothetical protein IT161_16165 [Bryobacterales bacterium]|nr:hypothetical protein [Bryobacterales bacterium]
MPVLQYLDVAIGYVLAILLAATAVGAAMQAIQTLARVRQHRLRDGLASLIAGLGPELAKEARQLAVEMTNESRVKGGNTAAEVISREEFIFLLLRKAAEGGPDSSLGKTVKSLTGKDAADVITAIQELLVQEEVRDPKAPSYLWKVRAIAEAGCGKLAGRVFAWYDHTMDRVEDRVNFNGRLISAVLALVVCFALNLDSIDLVQRLSRDETFRKALVERAIEEVKKLPPQPAAAPLPPGAEPKLVPAVEKALDAADKTRQLLTLKPVWDTDNKLRKLFGVLISWAMVSLGAPFWFGVLNKALGLRSTLAQKVEQQRNQRDADATARA